MPQRIVISPDGIRISKPGYDATTASDENMVLFPNMVPMIPVLTGTVSFGGVGSQDFALPYSLANNPYVILRSNDGIIANRTSYCAEMWRANGVYSTVRIRNIDGAARTVTFFVLR